MQQGQYAYMCIESRSNNEIRPQAHLCVWNLDQNNEQIVNNMHMWSLTTRQNGSIDTDKQMQKGNKDQTKQGTEVIYICIWGLHTKQNNFMDKNHIYMKPRSNARL